jgi:hypothetical protein
LGCVGFGAMIFVFRNFCRDNEKTP